MVYISDKIEFRCLESILHKLIRELYKLVYSRVKISTEVSKLSIASLHTNS